MNISCLFYLSKKMSGKDEGQGLVPFKDQKCGLKVGVNTEEEEEEEEEGPLTVWIILMRGNGARTTWWKPNTKSIPCLLALRASQSSVYSQVQSTGATHVCSSYQSGVFNA